MPETLMGLVLLIVFLLPGFVLVQASTRDKLYKPRSDLDFVLRGLALSLLVHLAFFGWTAYLYRGLQDRAADRNRSLLEEVAATPANSNTLAAEYRSPVSPIDVWAEDAAELFAYALIVVAIAPIAIGTVLGRYLVRLELKGGRLPWWADLLGAGTVEPPRAWDALPSQLGAGGWVIVRLRNSGNVIGGKAGTKSLVNLGREPDILIEELWWLDEYGNPLTAIEPKRAAWVSRDRIESLLVIPAPPQRSV